MLCPSCGTESRPEDRFCRKCGSKISGSAPKKSSGLAIVASLIVTAVVLYFLVGQARDYISKRQVLAGFVPYVPGQAPQEPPVLTGSLLRLYQPGDHWNFTSTFHTTDPNGQVESGMGRGDEGIYVSTLAGKPVLTDRDRDVLSTVDGRGMIKQGNTYFQQDQSRNYQELAEDEGSANTLQDNTHAATIMPGDIVSACPFSFETDNVDTNIYTGEMKITGNKMVRVLPDGKLTDCWPVSITGHSTEGNFTTTTGIYSPAIGNFIQNTTNVKYYDGGAITETSTLTSYYLR